MKQLASNALEIPLIKYLPVCNHLYFISLPQREVQCDHVKGN